MKKEIERVLNNNGLHCTKDNGGGACSFCDIRDYWLGIIKKAKDEELNLMFNELELTDGDQHIEQAMVRDYILERLKEINN